MIDESATMPAAGGEPASFSSGGRESGTMPGAGGGPAGFSSGGQQSGTMPAAGGEPASFSSGGRCSGDMPAERPALATGGLESGVERSVTETGEPNLTTRNPFHELREPDEAALRLAEALVFASVTPMAPRALSQVLPDDIDAAAVIEALRARYHGRGIELVEIGGGLQFRSAPDLAPLLRKIVQVPRRLPRVALETLAIIAYHQPVTRPEIEDIRGAGLSQVTLDILLEHALITTRGRKETPGRPTLWGTTPAFLEHFGLRDIRELPRRQDLLLETPRPPAKAADAELAGDAAAPAEEKG